MLGFLKQNAAPTTRRTVTFGGLDRRAGAGEGRFAQMQNLSSKRYPYLSPTRADKVEILTDAEAVFYWDGVRIMVEGGQLWYGDEAICNVKNGPKEFAVINSKLVVWPDGLAVDLTDKTVTKLEAQAVNRGTAKFTTSSLSLLPESVYAQTSIKLGGSDGREPYMWTYDTVAWDETDGWTVTGGKWLLPHNSNGRYYIPTVTYSQSSGTYSAGYPVYKRSANAPTTSAEPGNDVGFYGRVTEVVDYQWSTSSYSSELSAEIFWAQQAGQPLEGLFRVGDAVTVTNTTGSYCKQDIIIQSIDATTNTITFASGTFPGETTTTHAVMVTRRVPNLDHICQQDNRLWGVCSADNCIYASALGDPCNFYRYKGLSTDSYTVAVGSEGDFTAICSFGGSVLCFKENALHKVLGTLPDNYHLTTYTMPGVARDSGTSLVCLGAKLYYLGTDGVYSSSGGLPDCISQPLGHEHLTGGVGGTDGKCYYLSVLRKQEAELLVFDPALGLWYRRDASRPTAMARGPEGLVCLERDTLRTLEAGEGPVEWQGELAPMYEDMDRMQYTRLHLRAHLEPGSWLSVEACYDDGGWQRLGLVRAVGHKVARLELPLRRCAQLRLRLSGVGDCTVLELEREFRKRGRG